jgi:hypothetical protein
VSSSWVSSLVLLRGGCTFKRQGLVEGLQVTVEVPLKGIVGLKPLPLPLSLFLFLIMR